MKKLTAAVRTLTVGVALGAFAASAQQASVNLGSTATFAALAGTTVTVTGGGGIGGSVGISPGTAYVAGTPPVTIKGTLYAGGPIAAQAQKDLSAAYNDAAGRTQAPITVAGNIGGSTLAPGLYKSTSSLAVSSGDLTLDAQGNANAIWIFQIASTLTTTAGRQVILAGGANPNNIFWQVGTSATIGTTSVFQGNILAAASISMLTGSTLNGRALAMAGAVTIDTGNGNSVSIPAVVTGPPAIVSELSAASYRSPVVAGSIASIFGSNLSVGVASAGANPLPNTLAQSSFKIGGQAAPMYFATPSQVNVQIPWEMANQTLPLMVVTVNGVSSNPQAVALANYAPGIFTIDSSGSGQGAILVGSTAQLATVGSPAIRGGYIAIFCTGLGPVTNQPATGAFALVNPLSASVITPTVTIGGAPAQVSFSGLAPGFAGLYQVNVLVPANVSPGNTVAVVMSFGAITSNTVTIAVQ